MTILGPLIGIILLVVLLAPFFIGPGGLLQAASSINSSSQLEALKEAILKRYLDDERAFQKGDLSPLGWEKRRAFLVNRYIDAARRLDFVRGMQSHAQDMAESKDS